MKLISLAFFLFWGGRLLAQNNYVATSPSSATPGSNNTIIGINSGNSVTSAQKNVMIGNSSGGSTKSVRDNVYIGYGAALRDTSNSINGESVYIGSEVAFNLKNGTYSTLIGASAGRSLLSAYGSTIIGYNSAGSLKNSTFNTMIGENAGTSYTGASSMVCVGLLSGTGRVIPSPLTGSESTYLGFQAAGADGLSNATAIGANAFVSLSNSLVLGNKYVNVGIGNSAPHNKLEITALEDNKSGLRFTNLSFNSPSLVNNGKVLSVDLNGDVILTTSTDLSAILSRLDLIEKANTDQKKQISALQQANADLTKRVAVLEGQRSTKKR